jgi:hypothetical protein
MSGGITQLVATGVQDAYLSGSPEVSFFRSSYKRYTHFASTVERQLIQGTISAGSTSLIRFEKKGDLLSHVYFTSLDPRTNMSNVLQRWDQVIDKIELLIGGQIIDTHDFKYCSNIEPVVGAQTFSTRDVTTSGVGNFFPLKFFFCKDWQSVLPLVALQYHDVELRITWGDAMNDSIAVWTRFIYLDKEEREYFANKSHDILITQVHRSVITAVNNYEFALSQPVKFIAFESNNYATVYTKDATGSGPPNQAGDPASVANAALLQFKIQINGNDIGETKSLDHWVDVNQYYLTPFGYKPYAGSAGSGTANVAIVPFCLDTSKLQPTGTINFSRIDTFRLIAPVNSNFQLIASAPTANKSQYFYAVNYNILRIQNGMAGVLYAS